MGKGLEDYEFYSAQYQVLHWILYSSLRSNWVLLCWKMFHFVFAWLGAGYGSASPQQRYDGALFSQQVHLFRNSFQENTLNTKIIPVICLVRFMYHLPCWYFSLSPGSASCDSGPIGYSSTVGSKSCSQCLTGIYSSPSLPFLSPKVTQAPSKGLQLYYRCDNVFSGMVGNIPNEAVVYDATLQNGAVVFNNQLMLSAASSQYMSIGSFKTSVTFFLWVEIVC